MVMVLFDDHVCAFDDHIYSVHPHNTVTRMRVCVCVLSVYEQVEGFIVCVCRWRVSLCVCAGGGLHCVHGTQVEGFAVCVCRWRVSLCVCAGGGSHCVCVHVERTAIEPNREHTAIEPNREHAAIEPNS